MLGLLPLIAFLLFFILLGNLYLGWGWRKTFIRALLLWAGFVVLSTELLSLFSGIQRWTLTVLWLFPILAMVSWGIRRKRRGIGIVIPRLPHVMSASDWIFIAIIALVIGLTALVAWVAPPNTGDSLNYHMARVAHWAQNSSVDHYATGIETQNGIGPFSEFAILHFYLLSSGDRLANFVQWFAMLGSLVAVSIIALQLGGKRISQLLACVFVSTLPMGIAQATSTMTDYVVGFLILCVAIEILSILSDEGDRYSFVFLGLAVGLAIGAKPTSYAYLLPFAVLVGILLIKKYTIKDIVRYVAIVVLIILILNLGHLTRNMLTYGIPIGDPRLLNEQSNELKTLPGLISNTVRHASLHAGTPWPAVNSFIMKGIIKIHLLLDLSKSDPRTTSIGPFAMWRPRNEETFAGNSLHAYLYLLSIFLLVVFSSKFRPRIFIYSFFVLSTFLVISFVFKWQVFSSRYHLPFFLLYTPVAAVVIERVLPKGLNVLLAVLFLVLSYPWLLSLQNRPLLLDLRDVDSSSILTRPRDAWFFGRNQSRYDLFAEMTGRINQAQCSDVAMMISGNGAEYPIWVYLGAPRNDLEIYWFVAGTYSAKYAKKDFEPCAVFCQNCPEEWDFVLNLPLVFESGDYGLYLNEESSLR